MASILRIANLCKTYKITNQRKQEVLKGIDLELDKYDMVALLGESGSGKSTLLNILGGLDTDYTGSVVVKGKFIRDFSEKEMDNYRKDTIGFVFQNYNLISHMTIFENVEIALQMSDVAKDVRKQRTLELLKMVGLESHINKLPNQLSGGQRQRVSIARCLANNPDIILADEPTGALDKESAEQVLEILKKISEMGKLVIVVTHSSKVARECSRVIKLDDGVLVSDELLKEKRDYKYEKMKRVATKNIKIKDLFLIALRNIKQKLSRSLLVSFAISIGIAALIVILCLSKGITEYVKEYYGQQEYATLITVTNDNEEISSDVIEEIKDYEGVYSVFESYYETNYYLNYENTNRFVSYIQPYLSYNRPEIIYGSEISNDSEIVIDLDLATKWAPNGAIEVLGKTISMSSSDGLCEFKIVGIYNGEYDSEVFITSKMLSQIRTNDYTNIFFLSVDDITYLEGVNNAIKLLGLNTITYDDSSQVVLEYIDLGTKVLTAVACISMFVSAIMIIIVMYISVIERTQEIGILRSIGSRKKDIYNIFMFESSILGAAGGVMGCIISIIISLITNGFSSSMVEFSFISYSVLYYLIGFAISMTVSLVAGIAPSYKASKLDPIEALRFE